MNMHVAWSRLSGMIPSLNQLVVIAMIVIMSVQMITRVVPLRFSYIDEFSCADYFDDEFDSGSNIVSGVG